MTLLKAFAGLLLLFLIVSGNCSAQTFDFLPLPFYGGTGLNDTGQMVGTSFGAQTGYKGFIYQGGVLTSFEIPGSSRFSTHATGINDAGEIVGWYNDQSGTHGYSGTLNAFNTIDVPGQTITKAMGINNAGSITGSYVDSNGSTVAFIRNLSFQAIAPELGDQTVAQAINAAGQIVGSFMDSAGQQHGFLLNAYRAVTVIDVPGSIATAAYGINEAGMIVGQFTTQTDGIYQTHGFIDINGVFTTIDAPDASTLRYTSAQAINNQNQILLNGSTSSWLATFAAVSGPTSAAAFHRWR